MTKHTILFLAANPLGTSQLALEAEAKAIEAELATSGHGDTFQFVTRWAAQPKDLLTELRRLKPTVLHFSGHGVRSGSSDACVRAAHRDIVGAGESAANEDPDTGDGDRQHSLVFQRADGLPQLVSAEALAEAFEAVGASVKLIVLNACYSDAQAEALLAHVDCVVGMTGAIHDDAARSFAVGFYGAIGDRESVAAAHKHGCALISLDGLPDSKRPQVRSRDSAARRLILADLVPAPSGGWRELPYDVPDADGVSDFVGRGDELAAMAQSLVPTARDRNAGHAKRRRPQLPMFVITGPSGIGKSLLAQKFADRSRGKFEAAVHIPFADRADAMARSIAERFRVDAKEIEASDSVAKLVKLCGEYRTLVTIDDAREAKPVSDLVKDLPATFSVIVTTQNRTLRELAEHDNADLKPLGLEQSLALLARLRGDDTIQTSAEAKRICEVVGHLPRALKLVVEYCRRSPRATLKSFVEQFCANEDRKRLFERGLRPQDDRESLAKVIDTVLEAAKPHERQFYRCLSACDPAGFSVETAAKAAQCDDLQEAEMLLNDFHARALLEYAAGSDDRYAFHALFYAYTTELARKYKDELPARTRHAELWMDRLRDSDLTSTLVLPDFISANRGDIALAAIRTTSAAQGELDHGLVEQINEFFDRAHLPAQAAQAMEAVVSWADRSGAPAASALARIRCAKFRGRLDPVAAHGVLDEAERILAQLPDGPRKQSVEVKRLIRLGALRKRSDLQLALETLQRAVQLARELADPTDLERALYTLAGALHGAGRFDEALPVAREAFELGRGSATVTSQFFTRRLFADCLLYAGDFAGAVQAYIDCWQSASSDVEGIFLASHLMDIAQALRNHKRIAEARNIIQLQAQVASKLANTSLYVRGLIVLGDICIKDDDVPGALDAFDKVATRISELRDTRPVTGTLRFLATTLQARGRLAEEERTLRLAVVIAEAGGDFEIVARLVNRIGLIYARHGRSTDARANFENQLQLAKSHGFPQQEVYARQGLASLHREADEYELELEQLKLAVTALDKVTGQAAIKGRIEILGRQMIAAMHVGECVLALRAMISYERALLHAKNVEQFASAPPHNTIAMALKRLGGAPQLIRALRAAFEHDPAPEAAAVLAPRVTRIVDGICMANAGPEDWASALTFAMDLMLAAQPCKWEPACVGLLRRTRDEMQRREDFDVMACIERSSEGSPAARESLRAFLTIECVLNRAAGTVSVRELRAAEPTALNFPTAMMRSYLCKRLADRFRASEYWADAELLYRAAIDACEASSNHDNQAKALLSLQAVLQRMPGRDLDALAHLERFVANTASLLEDIEPAKQALITLGERLFGAGDLAAAQRAAAALATLGRQREAKHIEARAANLEGKIYRATGDHTASLAAYRRQIVLGIAGNSQRPIDYGLSHADDVLRIESNAPVRQQFWRELAQDLESISADLARTTREYALCRLGHDHFQLGQAAEACEAFITAVLVEPPTPARIDATRREFLDAIHSLELARTTADALLALGRSAASDRATVATDLLRCLRDEIARHERPRPRKARV